MQPRRRTGRPPPISDASEDEPAIELEVRVQPGTEEGALKELRELGATGEVVGRGELRVQPGGPLRPILSAERTLAFYAVRRVGAVDPDDDATVRAALALAGVVANLQRGKLRTYRVTAAQELGEDYTAVNRLGQFVGSRLGLQRTLLQPELILIVRPSGAGGIELAARLPKPGQRPPRPPVAPPARSSPRPRRARRG